MPNGAISLDVNQEGEAIQNPMTAQPQGVEETVAQPMAQERQAVPVAGMDQQAGGPQGAKSRPASIEQLAERFAQLAQAAPDVAEEVMQDAQMSGLSGQMLEDIGIMAVMAILDPNKWPQIRQTMAQKYPQDSQALPEDYAEAEPALYQIAFAAFLQDGGEI